MSMVPPFLNPLLKPINPPGQSPAPETFVNSSQPAGFSKGWENGPGFNFVNGPSIPPNGSPLATARALENDADVHSVVYACVHTVALGMLAAPMQIFSGPEDDAELLDDATRRVNALLTPDLLMNLYVAMLACGDGVAAIKTNRFGLVSSLEYLDYRYLMIRRISVEDERTGERTVTTVYDYYAPEVAQYGGYLRPSEPRRIYFETEVLRIRLEPHPVRPWAGFAPWEAARGSVVLDRAAESHETGLMLNGLPAWVMSPTPDEDTALNRWDDDTLEELRSSVNTSIIERQNGRVMITDQPLTIQELGSVAPNFNFVLIRNTPSEHLAACYGVPPPLVGHATGTSNTNQGASLRESQTFFAEGRLRTNLVLIIPQLTRQLLERMRPQIGRRSVLRFDFFRMPGYRPVRELDANRAAALFKVGLINRNQGLKMIGEPPIDGPKGEEYAMPAGIEGPDTVPPDGTDESNRNDDPDPRPRTAGQTRERGDN